MWEVYKKGYKAYLQLEKSMSDNSIEAYMHDLEKLTQYLSESSTIKSPADIELTDLQQFMKWIGELGMTASSQARIISGIKSFYRYCLMEQISIIDPTALLEAPKLKRSLPDILSFDEIESIISQLDLSKPEGGRNKAILETMYSCGLRVSEVVNLKISQLYLDVGFIRVLGKGDKERLVPIGNTAIKFIELYRKEQRVHVAVQQGEEDILFLN
jgi:integrase/recombinase XerD